jgi:biopolymer transport protein ExbD
MGGPSPEEGKGGKRPLDYPLNLVPYIDLMSVLICFLMATAIWTTMTRINVDQATKSTSQQQSNEEDKRVLNIVLHAQGIDIGYSQEAVTKIPKGSEGYDYTLLDETLKTLKGTAKKNQRVRVAGQKTTVFKDIIKVVDLCLGHELSAISFAEPDLLWADMLMH